MSKRPPGLDDPAYAAFAWARYRRLMWWMALAAALAVVAALAWLRTLGPIPIHMLIATAAGVFATIMLGAALMGLVFLSSGTGHDEDADAHANREL